MKHLLALTGLLLAAFTVAQPAVSLVREVFIVNTEGEILGPHHGPVTAGQTILYRISGQNDSQAVVRSGEVRVLGQFIPPDGLMLEVDWESLSLPNGFVRQGAPTALRWTSSRPLQPGDSFEFSYRANVVLAVAGSPTRPSVSSMENVTYRVTVPPGCRGLVTLTGAGGVTEQHEVGITWSYRFRASPGDHLYLSVQNHCDRGSVSVAITKDGVLYRTARSTGPYVIATASGEF